MPTGCVRHKNHKRA